MLKESGKIPNESLAAHRTDRIHISAKKTLQYYDNGETPTGTFVSHDHTHIMDRALQTTSALGFILRNMNHELCSRFTDELVSTDRYAKGIGNPNIANRAKLGASFGIGNSHFYKYSILGHVYILIQIILEEANKGTIHLADRQASDTLESILSHPNIYARLNCFPKEIANTRLTTTAKSCIRNAKMITKSEVLSTLWNGATQKSP
jgi:hypothetical protein